MTNYNERLDEIIEALWQYSVNDRLDIGTRPDEAKQAITSLIRELVAEAKPFYELVPPIGSIKDREMKCAHRDGHNKAIKEFEQNLLKALEEE